MKLKLPAIALAAFLFAGLPVASSNAYVAISVGIAPPAIPIYQQPYCPAPGHIWTPGYWNWDGYGYYWVPGVWVAPPRIGLLWTPGYWGYRGGRYHFNQGYWGPRVGFYGGINYGFGYFGSGYYGGQWRGNTFAYNTAVSRVNTNVIHTTYVNRSVATNRGSRAGFNGPGGAKAIATAQERAAAKARRAGPTAAQSARVEAAKKNPALHAKNNGGKPKPEAVSSVREKINRDAPGARENAANAKAPRKAGVRQTNQKERTRPGQQDRIRPEQANRASDRSRAERAPARTARSAERPTVRNKRTTEAQQPRQVRRPVQPQRKVEPRKPTFTPRSTQRQQVQRRPQSVRRPQAAPARERGPAQEAPENTKKKRKKKANDDR